MSNSTRTKLFASLLNSRLGKPNSCNRFETYVNIVLSYNTVLPSHVDKKNDHRAGYDHCAVYTFATIFSGRVCRVAIIMTSHTVSESWLKNRLQLTTNLNTQHCLLDYFILPVHDKQFPFNRR